LILLLISPLKKQQKQQTEAHRDHALLDHALRTV
jgi:hypothetical protein